jgi:tRNA(Ile)-lysidine synthase
LEHRLNPRLRESLVRTAEILRADNEVIETLVQRWWDRHGGDNGQSLACQPLRRLPLALRRRVLQKWLLAAGLPAEGIDFELIERLVLLVAESAGSVGMELPDHRHVIREYDDLRIIRRGISRKQSYARVLKIPGVTMVPNAGLRVEVVIQPGLLKQPCRIPGQLPAVASLGRVVRNNLTIRSWRAGDRMRPFGLNGSKKIQDILTDAKVPKADRNRIPVVTHGDEIVWLPGYRVAGGWEVTDKQAPALRISINHLKHQ